MYAETLQTMLEQGGGALWRGVMRAVQAGDHSPDMHEAFAVPALAHWRHTRGLYEFDATLMEALTDTPLDEVPLAAIRNLPEYAPYIALNGLRFLGEPLHGAWVLRFVGREDVDSLQIVLHREGDRVWSMSLTGGGTIQAAVDRAFGSVRARVEAGAPTWATRATSRRRRRGW
ncbi:hypothetical protein [Deinococcus multiflagellatus]|uniref:Uncharacterized protein n=1 Tax=Deinococcus multiflagellatus TaxID=1656887 RepID=A0ABW1ZFY4_9DEIO